MLYWRKNRNMIVWALWSNSNCTSCIREVITFMHCSLLKCTKTLHYVFLFQNLCNYVATTCHLFRKTNHSYRLWEDPISKHTTGLGRNINLIMGSKVAPNHERLWRRDSGNLMEWTGVDLRLMYEAVSIISGACAVICTALVVVRCNNRS
jgi:hypothetical protein